MSQEYDIEAVIGRKPYGKSFKYKIKWRGYSRSQCTWQTLSDVPDVRQEYDAFYATCGKGPLDPQPELTLGEQPVNPVKPERQRSRESLPPSTKKSKGAKSTAKREKTDRLDKKLRKKTASFGEEEEAKEGTPTVQVEVDAEESSERVQVVRVQEEGQSLRVVLRDKRGVQYEKEKSALSQAQSQSLILHYKKLFGLC